MNYELASFFCPYIQQQEMTAEWPATGDRKETIHQNNSGAQYLPVDWKKQNKNKSRPTIFSPNILEKTGVRDIVYKK